MKKQHLFKAILAGCLSLFSSTVNAQQDAQVSGNLRLPVKNQAAITPSDTVLVASPDGSGDTVYIYRYAPVNTKTGIKQEIADDTHGIF